jgi:hypothetical protein
MKKLCSTWWYVIRIYQEDIFLSKFVLSYVPPLTILFGYKKSFFGIELGIAGLKIFIDRDDPGYHIISDDMSDISETIYSSIGR